MWQQRPPPLLPSLQVLRHCCANPRTIEALVNSYEHVRVTEEWAEAVPPELVQVSLLLQGHPQALFPPHL